MANTVQVLITEGGFLGSRNLIFTVNLQSDGITGDLVKYTIMDPMSLGLTSAARFSIYRIDYNFAGFDAIVEFDAGVITPTQKWVLTEGSNAPVDFTRVGGVKDTSGIDGTGKLQLTTMGFTSTQDAGSILFKLRMP